MGSIDVFIIVVIAILGIAIGFVALCASAGYPDDVEKENRILGDDNRVWSSL